MQVPPGRRHSPAFAITLLDDLLDDLLAIINTIFLTPGVLEACFFSFFPGLSAPGCDAGSNHSRVPFSRVIVATSAAVYCFLGFHPEEGRRVPPNHCSAFAD